MGVIATASPPRSSSKRRSPLPDEAFSDSLERDLPLKERHTLPERNHLPVIGRRADDGHNAAQLNGDGDEALRLGALDKPCRRVVAAICLLQLRIVVRDA